MTPSRTEIFGEVWGDSLDVSERAELIKAV